ncbi:MAG: formylglycine-generating enzyme family protein [Alphaproteobacteria bacterium]|nr:formylglycine-generating enzyme family protein [Alphaproteobacteria bacterium]
MSGDRLLQTGRPPPWAVAWGEDRHGVFAEMAVGRVRQRMRWMPSSRFKMGSPTDEAGRYEREGPQHEVVLTKGFWLGDTPVTQALWTAVMEENPSRFTHPQRPVERVSWADGQRFCERISTRAPGAPVRLPTEAEWEYACRAGTTAPTWLEGWAILGRNNAPVLDSIAWYGGNSGMDFDLEQGEGSGGWPEKQHPHQRAGTRVVGQKEPNPWGLYDMLGNVYEWCSDTHEPYSESVRTDPVGTQGSRRVVRGGSWLSNARYVRAAYRSANHPSGRDDYLGFRLARGPSAPEAG